MNGIDTSCGKKAILAVLVILAIPASWQSAGLLGLFVGKADGQITIGHGHRNLGPVPAYWIEEAKREFRISYQHTSHGEQIVVGMELLLDGPPYSNDEDGPPYTGELLDFYDDYHDGGSLPEGALSLWDFYYNEGRQMAGIGRDLQVWGNPPTWVTATRNHLDGEGADRNLIMWSWCGGVSDATEEQIQTKYLDLMNQLEEDYSNVTFVYMTGHLDGTGETGNLHQRNEQIREYCRQNNKVLFDFAEIERFDFEEVDHLDDPETDHCYWIWDWANDPANDSPVTMVGSEYSCRKTYSSSGLRYWSPHTHGMNSYNKGQAFWWMLARLAGWNGVSLHDLDYWPAQGSPSPGNREGDEVIDVHELLRLIQFYNSGGYHKVSDDDPTSEDGFGSGAVTSLPPRKWERHDLDYWPSDNNPGPDNRVGDWGIDIHEVLRAIQFYNSGGYHADADTEDGFACGQQVPLSGPSPLQEPPVGSRVVPGETYTPGEDLDIGITIFYEGVLTALAVEESVPSGWTFVSISGDDPPDIAPEAGADGADGPLAFAWITIPFSPVQFTYTVHVPSDEGGDKTIIGEILYRRGGGELSEEISQTSVTLAALAGFDVVGSDSGVVLKWQTSAEVDTAGFNVLRAESADGPWVKINENLIPSRGSSWQGASYDFADADRAPGTVYWYCIEEVRSVGTKHYATQMVWDDGLTDSDGDGMPDLWEGPLGIDTGSAADADADADEDGSTNLEEYLSGTSPVEAEDRPRLRIEYFERDLLALAWPARAGRTYKVQSATSLVDLLHGSPSLDCLTWATSSKLMLICLEDLPCTSNQRRFYRLIILPPR